jgi:nitric oxide reductase subunit B
MTSARFSGSPSGERRRQGAAVSEAPSPVPETISPWWRRSVIIVVVAGFAVLTWVSVGAYRTGAPTPEKVVGPAGETLFTGDDIRAGQEVFLKHALMENGSIWGHGAYLGPDFSAEYLHRLSQHAYEALAHETYRKDPADLAEAERAALAGPVRVLLKTNRYEPAGGVLTFTPVEADSFRRQIALWKEHFARSETTRGLPPKYIGDGDELRRLTAFFAWAAWASVADRPGKPYSYTNNFPYDPSVGNEPTAGAVLWSGLSLVALLAGTAAVLFAFGKFGYLGWRAKGEHAHSGLLPGCAADSQRAVIKYFVAAAVLLLVQVLAGAGLAHFRADPKTFYGIDIAAFLPSNLLRTWHLQTAVLWIATAYVGGGLLLASALGRREPRGQKHLVNVLFGALAVVVAGSLTGEAVGIRQLAGQGWYWLGLQGWEYLDLGRLWQVLLAVGMGLWAVLLVRGVGETRKQPEEREISTLFLLSAFAIPLFYLPAFFFGSTSSYTVVDTWRFWIIHLWVEGFFELFATVMVAVMFYKLGMVAKATALRVIYLDAILFLGAGIVGTGHHWYWTGQSSVSMALSATLSAMEPVPLILLTLDAWDFIKVTGSRCDVCGKSLAFPHKWTFYFLMAVGFWNFVGAGVFGFLINLPIVSYFEVGTVLTANHGHAAMMGVFGMLAVGLLVFALRQLTGDAQWDRLRGYVAVSFWGLNVGLALMVATNLFPLGVLQLKDALEHGYWHARGEAFLGRPFVAAMEWARLPADAVFIVLGVVPLVVASLLAYRWVAWPAKGPVEPRRT